jgi:hypothetical protein
MILGLASVVAGGVWALTGHARDASYAAQFKRVAIGDTRTEVIALMGAPSRDGGCTDDLVPGAPPGCAEEIVYSAAFAPLDPQYYVVRLDRGGRAIERTWTASP